MFSREKPSLAGDPKYTYCEVHNNQNSKRVLMRKATSSKIHF